MMKKRGMLLTLLCLVFVFAGLVACGDNPGKGTIVGAKEEIILKASETSCDFSAGVTGTLNGEAAQVEVDSSAVQFGVPGSYNVVYTLGDKTVTTTVKIYGTPTITAPDAEQSYADVLKWTVGVTATDSFGQDLEVVTTLPADYKEGDLLEYGKEYTVSYKTMDAAGNEASATRKLTVSEQGRPVFDAETLTLTEFDGTVALDTSGIVKVLDSSKTEVSDLFVKDSAGVLSYNPEYFAFAGTKDYSFTLVTKEGWNTLSVKVETGDAISVLKIDDVTDYIFETGFKPSLPEVEKAENNVNKYVFTYEIAKVGSEDFVSVEDFQPVSGDYVYRVSAKLASSKEEAEVISEQNFYIREGAELIDYAITEQNMGVFAANASTGATLGFAESVEMGEETSPAYLFTQGTTFANGIDYALQFNREVIAEKIEAGLTTISFEVGLKALAEDVTHIDVKFFAQFNEDASIPASNAINIAFTYNTVEAWTTFAIDFTAGMGPTATKLYYTDATGNVIFNYREFGLYCALYSGSEVRNVPQEIYIRNVRFGRTDTTRAYGVYTTAEEESVTLNKDGSAKVNGVDYTYELYQDNTVLFFDAARRISDFAMKFVPAGGEYDSAALVSGEKVYLAEGPVLSVGEAVNQKYSDAVQWTVGVTAADSLGNPLDVEVVSVSPEPELEGMLEYGQTYTVTYRATDNAGNTVTGERAITVTEDGKPVFEPVTLLLVNLRNQEANLPGDYVAAFNEEGVSVEAFVVNEKGKLVFNPVYFETLGVGSYTLKVVTTAGYGNLVVTVEEGGPMDLLTWGDITNYVYPVKDGLIDFPEVSAVGGSYEYDFEYRVLDSEGADLGDAQAFVANSAGNYTFRVRAKVKSESSWTVLSEQPFFIREGEDAISVFDPALSDQNMNFFIPNTEKGADLEFVEEVTIGGSASSAYRHSVAPYVADGWNVTDQMLLFDQQKLAAMIARGLTTLTFDIGNTSYGSPDTTSDVVWMNVELYALDPTPEGGATNSWGSISTTSANITMEGVWTTVTFDLAKGFTSPNTPTIYTIDESTGEVTMTFQKLGLRVMAYSQYGAGVTSVLWDQSQDVYFRNVRFGYVSDTASVQNTYKNAGESVVLGANGTATVGAESYTYELYRDGTVLFYNGVDAVYEFSAKYVEAGGEYGYAALVVGEKVYLSSITMPEDGDILALDAEGKVVFELPDFAEAVSGVEGFKYELKKIGGTEVLASVPGTFELTEAGAYEWIATFPSGTETETYAYQFYVCTADDPIGKVTTVNKDGASNATFRFDRMEESGPVFLLTGDSELFLDGDYVAEQLAASAESGGGYQLRVYVNNPHGQCYIMWEGQTHVAKPGCYANIGEYYALSPDMLAYVGEGDGGMPAYTRQGNENFSIWFQGGGPVEITSILYQKF